MLIAFSKHLIVLFTTATLLGTGCPVAKLTEAKSPNNQLLRFNLLGSKEQFVTEIITESTSVVLPSLTRSLTVLSPGVLYIRETEALLAPVIFAPAAVQVQLLAVFPAVGFDTAMTLFVQLPLTLILVKSIGGLQPLGPETPVI